MKPAISPTSPKSRSTPAVAEVWQHAPMQQPRRVPWGRITLLIIILSLLIGVGLTAGSVWIQRYGPTGWWTAWLPVLTTTVVQNSTARPASDAPKAVRDLAESLAGVAVDRGADGVYSQEDLLNSAVPLSDNGWWLTLQQPPAAETTLVVLPRPGLVQPLTSWLLDPASPLVFAKGGPSEESPATLADIADHLNQSVWVITPTITDQQIVQRRLVGSRIPAWPSSDRIERVYLLDGPVAGAASAMVSNQSGRLIGLLDEHGQVWPVGTIQSVLRSVIQSGQLERTSLGLRARRRDELVVPEEPTASGWLIGAGADQTAITENGAADRAGLTAGDIIVTLDGQPAGGDMFETLQRWQPGENLTLTIRRGQTERELTVQLSALRS